MVENAILVRKLSNIVENLLNNAFVMHTAFEKKDINALQKHTVLNLKRLVCKNLVLNMKKSSQDAVQKVGFFLLLYYLILIYYRLLYLKNSIPSTRFFNTKIYN